MRVQRPVPATRPGAPARAPSLRLSNLSLVREGSRGGDVKTLQKLLARDGIRVPASGVFDSQTAAAVRSYQKKHGLLVDGVVGQQTWGSFLGQKLAPGSNLLKHASPGIGHRPADTFEPSPGGRPAPSRPSGGGRTTGGGGANEVSGSGTAGISAQGRREMSALLHRAIAGAGGQRPRGWCLKRVEDFLQAGSYGKIGGGRMPRFPYARNFAEYLNAGGRWKSLGLKRLNITNPYDAPPGAIVVVRAGTPGTHHPTAGDIVIAAGGGRFLNDGEMGYGGPGNFPRGNSFVLGVYVPA